MENIKNAYCRNNPRSTVKSAELNLTRAVPRLLLIASRNEWIWKFCRWFMISLISGKGIWMNKKMSPGGRAHQWGHDRWKAIKRTNTIVLTQLDLTHCSEGDQTLVVLWMVIVLQFTKQHLSSTVRKQQSCLVFCELKWHLFLKEPASFIHTLRELWVNGHKWLCQGQTLRSKSDLSNLFSQMSRTMNKME